jgi:hypothetical protein
MQGRLGALNGFGNGAPTTGYNNKSGFSTSYGAKTAAPWDSGQYNTRNAMPTTPTAAPIPGIPTFTQTPDWQTTGQQVSNAWNPYINYSVNDAVNNTRSNMALDNMRRGVSGTGLNEGVMAASMENARARTMASLAPQALQARLSTESGLRGESNTLAQNNYNNAFGQTQYGDQMNQQNYTNQMGQTAYNDTYNANMRAEELNKWLAAWQALQAQQGQYAAMSDPSGALASLANIGNTYTAQGANSGWNSFGNLLGAGLNAYGAGVFGGKK